MWGVGVSMKNKFLIPEPSVPRYADVHTSPVQLSPPLRVGQWLCYTAYAVVFYISKTAAHYITF
jgi:hypothetical protein